MSSPLYFACKNSPTWLRARIHIAVASDTTLHVESVEQSNAVVRLATSPVSSTGSVLNVPLRRHAPFGSL